MVHRRDAKLTLSQLEAKTGIRFHSLRRFEIDRCIPSEKEWGILRSILKKLPEKPVLDLTRSNIDKNRGLAGFDQQILQYCSKERKTLTQVAKEIGICLKTISKWRKGAQKPSSLRHIKILRSLGIYAL
jgi:transcriptional regulator with XRE-family HTH domain